MSDKLDKQKAFLQNYLEKINLTLNHGIPTLKYLGVDCNQSEKLIQNLRSIFDSSQIPNKKIIIKAVQEYDDETSYLIYLFSQTFNHPDKYTTNPLYANAVSLTKQEKKNMKVAEKVSKYIDKHTGKGHKAFCD